MVNPTWEIGAVRITCIVEQEALRQPQFGYRNLTTKMILGQDWLRPHFATEAGELRSNIQAFVVESQGQRIVVDACAGNDKKRDNPARNEMQVPFLEDLAAAGFARESIDTVLCTHLHIDHVGWNTMLIDGAWVPTFPNARYLFGREEWAHWSKEAASEVGGDMDPEVVEALIECPAVKADSIRPVIEAGLHELVELDHRVTEEVRLEPTPGHTPGHVSVTITSAGARAVITGDLMHHPIQCALPHVSSKFDHDVAHARETRKAFLERYGDSDVTVIGTHFAVPTGGRLVKAGEGWRLSGES